MSATTPRQRHPVATVKELPPGARKIVSLKSREIGVFNVNGNFHAVLNICPHELAPVCKGHLGGTLLPSAPGQYIWGCEGAILACPWHGWEFNLLDGKSLHDPSCHLKVFDTQVEDETVYVLL